MATPNDIPHETIAIRDAFSALPEDKMAEAEARVGRYVALVHRIYEDICEDSLQYDAFKRCLTELAVDDSMRTTNVGPPTDAPAA